MPKVTLDIELLEPHAARLSEAAEKLGITPSQFTSGLVAAIADSQENIDSVVSLFLEAVAGGEKVEDPNQTTFPFHDEVV